MLLLYSVGRPSKWWETHLAGVEKSISAKGQLHKEASSCLLDWNCMFITTVWQAVLLLRERVNLNQELQKHMYVMRQFSLAFSDIHDICS